VPSFSQRPTGPTTGTSHAVNFSYRRVPEPVLGEACLTTEQTANLQTALLHLDEVRAQIPTAQQDSIHSKSSP
jgi:hypothetical protein